MCEENSKKAIGGLIENDFSRYVGLYSKYSLSYLGYSLSNSFFLPSVSDYELLCIDSFFDNNRCRSMRS